MKSVLLIGLPLILAAVFLFYVVKRGRKGSYKAKALLTENEKEFFSRLVEALPKHHVFPQVSLGALLQASAGNRKEHFRIRATFSQKIADFVICDRDLKVVAVVELDDRTHNPANDAKRDAMLNEAGYRTIRWHSRRKPDIAEIRKAFS